MPVRDINTTNIAAREHTPTTRITYMARFRRPLDWKEADSCKNSYVCDKLG